MVVVKEYQLYSDKDSLHIGFLNKPKCDNAKGMSIKALQFLCQNTDKNGLLCSVVEPEDGKLVKPLDSTYLWTTIPYYDTDGVFCCMDLVLFEYEDDEACKVLATLTLNHTYKVIRWNVWDWRYLQELLWLYSNGEYLPTEVLGEEDRPVYRYWDQNDHSIIQIMEA